MFRGRYVAQPPITEFPNAEHLNELMIVGPLTVRSACSHHFCPVIGKIWIGVMPNEHTNVIGLSKYARLVDWIMGRPKIQEEAVVQLADLIMEKTQPDGLAIVMEASHFCMSWRGVRDMDSKMINSVMRGVFLGTAPCAANSSPSSRKELTMLVRLLYASRAVDLGPAAIEAILTQSRQHNPARASPACCAMAAAFLQSHRRRPFCGERAVWPHPARPAPQECGTAALRRNCRAPFWWLDHGAGQPLKINSILLKYSEKPELDPYTVSGRCRLRCSKS